MTRLLALTVLLAACGGTEAPAPAPAPAPAEKPAEKPKPAPAPAAPEMKTLTPDAEGVVRVEATDAMKYNTNRIEVEGTKVKLELKHVGKLEKKAMGHNLVVLKPGTDPLKWAGGAIKAVDTDYIPAGDEAIIAHTKLLGGGESDTIEFEVPGPGEYPFLCSFPGHAGIMKGVLVVK